MSYEIKPKEILPQTLNLTGCELLCQGLICSAVDERDKSFFTSELGIIAKIFSVRSNNYDIEKIISRASPIPCVNGKKYDAAILEKEAMTMTLQMMADKYHTSEKNIKSALSRRKIRWNGMTGNREYYRLVENGQLEFVF